MAELNEWENDTRPPSDDELSNHNWTHWKFAVLVIKS